MRVLLQSKIVHVVSFCVQTGDVSFPNEHGEDMHAEVFAVLWESPRAASKTTFLFL